MLPPLISFNSAVDLKRALRATNELSETEEKSFDKLLAAGLPPLISPTVFGLILGVSPKLITSLATHPRRKYPYYRQYEIPKKNGGTRTILAPRTYLKAVQKFILRRILETQGLPNWVTGFVKGKGIVQNASVHVGARYLLNVDVKDFFPSVRTKEVFKVFYRLGFSSDMSRVLSMLCTYNNSLPQGAPTSPYLANLVFQDIDADVMKICGHFGLKYSRYADDLTLSGEQPIDRNIVTRLARLFESRGFRINQKKIKITKPGQAMYVTGLVINEKVHPDRRVRRLLRAMFHRASMRPREFRKRSAHLTGWASFVHSYDKKLGAKYLNVARSIASK